MQQKILIIDDDKVISDMYRLKFEQAGFVVEVLASGKKAVEKIDEYQPEALLLDIAMFPVDGFTVLEKINSTKLKKTPKIIILSNVGQSEEIERAKALGAVDYIVKANFTPSEVVLRVKQILGE